MITQELRIGNYIKYNDKTIVIDTIYYDSINVDFFNNDGIELDLLKPIELTEEVLFKCGFNKKQDYINGVGLCIFFEHKEFNYRLNQSFEVVLLKIKLNNLHQLQNLYFALTNKELNIQL